MANLRCSAFLAAFIGLIGAPVVPAASDEPIRGSAVSGPVLGYVFDGAVKGVRPILGLPGASVLGEPLEVGFEMSQAAVSPGQDYILAVAANTLELVQVRIDRSGFTLRPLALAAPDTIVLSATGAAAVLYYRAAGKIAVVSGLPDAAAFPREVDLSTVPWSISALAVSDDAGALLLATDDGKLLAAPSDGNARLIGTYGRLAAVAFLERSHDALVADEARNAVYLVRDAASPGEVLLLAGEQDGVAGPRQVVASRDGRRAVVVNGSSRELVVLRLAGGLPERVACDCAPTSLDRLAGNAVFRLTEADAGPLWVLDGDWPEPRAVFVAAAPSRAGGQQ